MAFREQVKEVHGAKLSVNDLIIKAAALALRRVPEANASFTDEGIIRYGRVDIGMAVAIEDGLVTPVIRSADVKTLGQIAAEAQDLAKRARDRKLKVEDMTGATFSVSQPGHDGHQATSRPSSTRPRPAILAVGTVRKEPVVKNDQIVIGQRMSLTLSCDHRVVDGALGARLLQAIVADPRTPHHPGVLSRWNTMADKYDLIVIGAGPGGYVAAIRGSQLGLKTACIERERAGRHLPELGLHPHQGAAEVGRGHAPGAARRRLRRDHQGQDRLRLAKVIARSRGHRRQDGQGHRDPVQEVQGRPHRRHRLLQGPGQAGRGHRRRQAACWRRKSIIVATGARAKFLPGIEPDGDRVITYREAMVLPELPKSVVVIGAGAIGVEFADFWNAFGAEVTIVEALPRLTPIEDEEISETLARAFKKKKISLHTGRQGRRGEGGRAQEGDHLHHHRRRQEPRP